jgi:hypothetical protein
MRPPPVLRVRIGGRDWLTLRPASLGARAWLLGVVAVQISVEDGEVLARARAHVTGAEEPRIEPLAPNAELHVTLLDEAEPAPPSPILPPCALSGAGAGLELFLNSVFVDCAALSSESRHATPPARGFGHVFCRWLRDCDFEPGFDLTDLISQPPGRKFERRVNRTLAVGETVSYRFKRG